MKYFITPIIFLHLTLLTSAQSYLPKSKGELIKHSYYTLSYSKEHEQAKWVYYILTDDMVNGNAVRKDDFRPDPKISNGSATPEDYKGTGYDKGHLAPAADMRINKTAMSESFFMSNMSPQKPDLNRIGWSKIEKLVRGWCVKYGGEIQVATGPIFGKSKKTIGKKNKVTVPEGYYKIVYAPSINQMIAFIVPNQKLTKPSIDYINTVDKVEHKTNIDFFSSMSKKQQKDLESQIDATKWSF